MALTNNYDLKAVYKDIERVIRHKKTHKIDYMFPEEGPLRRELYRKHLKFFRTGPKFIERLFMAGNRVGKTITGAYEISLHATGNYPDWWQGKKFSEPVSILVAGDTYQTTRDILQKEIMGGSYDSGEWGTGMLSLSVLDKRPLKKRGVSDTYDIVFVKHKSGKYSKIYFRSYDQGRKIFQGISVNIFWADEEVPQNIYEEGLIRTMTNRGICILTFTPLMGITPLVQNFMEDSLKEGSNKIVITAGWDDAPHLTKQMKETMEKSLSPHQRDARIRGIPSIGSGAIYPVNEQEIICKPFPISPHWPKIYGFDVGWKKTAAIWGAWDRDSDTVYLYSEHYKGMAEPAVHASAIKKRGEWITGIIDTSAHGRSQNDGVSLFNLYEDEGLNIVNANKAIESGLLEVYQRLSSGRLKVFSTLDCWIQEYRIYRRNEKGLIVKDKDHLMDATRYLVMGLSENASVRPSVKKQKSVRTTIAGY